VSERLVVSQRLSGFLGPLVMAIFASEAAAIDLNMDGESDTVVTHTFVSRLVEIQSIAGVDLAAAPIALDEEFSISVSINVDAPANQNPELMLGGVEYRAQAFSLSLSGETIPLPMNPFSGMAVFNDLPILPLPNLTRDLVRAENEPGTLDLLFGPLFLATSFGGATEDIIDRQLIELGIVGLYEVGVAGFLDDFSIPIEPIAGDGAEGNSQVFIDGYLLSGEIVGASVSVIPEPSTSLLLALGLGVLSRRDRETRGADSAALPRFRSR